MFDIEIFNKSGFLELIFRFIFHIIILLTLVIKIYHKNTHNKKFSFTFILVGTMVFFICFLLENVKIKLGFALGLFAIFGIIRYRSISISVKEMTYLFVTVGLSIINAITNKHISYSELIITNVIILICSYITEKKLLTNNISSFNIIYENANYINTTNAKELAKHLECKLNIEIIKIEVKNINYTKNSAELKIYTKKNMGDNILIFNNIE